MSALFGTTALAVLASTPAQSQSDTGGGELKLEEITVTAQRRVESLIDAPLSLAAIDAGALRNQGIARVEELQLAVPGLVMQYGQAGTLSPFLRGVGNALSGNYAENSVAIYVDDVPRPRLRGATDMPFVDRLEVLKGPQGALYGRNATGGAINIITRQPNFEEMSADVRLSLGSSDLIEAAGYVNVPLAPAFAFNIAASHRERDGLIENKATNATNPLKLPTRPAGMASGGYSRDKGFEMANTDSIDAKFSFQPNETVRVTLRGDYTKVNDTAGSGWTQQNPDVVANTLTFLTGQLITADDLQLGKPQHSSYADQLPAHELEEYGTSLKAELDFEAFTLTSITAYRRNTEAASVDIDATAIPFAGFTADFRSRVFSQELRAVSHLDGPLQFIAGATYFKDKVRDKTSGEIGAVLAGIGTYTREQILAGDIPRLSLPPTLGNIDADSWSVFGEISYDITDAWEIIASGRYTEEKREVTYPSQINTGFTEWSASDTDDAFTPALTLNYKLPVGGLVYARWAKGYKTGGFNNLLNPLTPDNLGQPVGMDHFEPEKLTSYEIGYKAELLDHRLRLIAAAFHYDYKSLQVQRVLSPQATSVIFNADKATIDGAELEVTARVSSYVNLSLGATYLDAKYDDFQVADLTQFDASGNRMISAPKLSLQGSVDFAVPMNDSWEFVGSTTASYRSKQYFDPENTVFNRQKGYTVVNGRIGVRNDKWGFYFFGKNIFDKKYATYAQTNSAGVVKNWGDRRVIGGTVEAHF
jgi:iron complex outermembrane receptor protein